jgi:endonuclease/exonuclease/phosphatase (EEP) superfamily protein YafD
MLRLRSILRLLVLLGWLATLGALVLVQLLGDRSAIGTVAMYAPRHLTPVAWLPVVLATLFVSWRLAVASLAGALVTLFFVAGFELPTGRAATEGATLRVVTYNTDRVRDVADRIRGDLAAWDADVVALIDCKTEVADTLRRIAPPGLFVSPWLCVVSRLPLVSDQAMPRAVVERGMAVGLGRLGRVHRFVFSHDGREVPIVVLHLESPRTALFAARNMDLSELPADHRRRATHSALVRRWLGDITPTTIVMGDFNLAVESAIYRRDWGEMTNAFSAAGTGFGHTMFAGRHRVRIDHVLVGEGWGPVRAEVLRGYPGEHEPVVVEVRGNRRG